MGKFNGKVVLITGATGGIGKASAQLFVKEGAKVILTDLTQASLDELSSSLGKEHTLGIAGTVTDNKTFENIVLRGEKEFGKIDAVFLNAGIEGPVQLITDYPDDDFDKVMAVNVRGVFLGLKHSIAALKRNGGGSIVITSSLGGLRGMPKISAYIASKHAVVGLMKSAALEVASLGIRVNTINPAPIATRMIEALENGFSGGRDSDIKQRMEKSVPLRRYGTPEEVAKLVMFLCSDEASYITGNTYPIDGGSSAK